MLLGSDSTWDHQLLAAINRVIHEPARLAILAQLICDGGTDFLSLERRTGLTRGNLSSHLSRLEAAGYVDVEKKFVEKTPRTLLRMTDIGREAFRLYRQNMTQLLGKLPD